LSKLVSLLLVFLILPSTSVAKVWRVRVGGNSDAPSIQAAIDSASVSDSVLVGTGTFWESINFKGKDIVVRSEFGAGSTTLDGGQSLAPVVSFKSGETRGAILEGFTITGGTGYSESGGPQRGGGILCVSSSPSILRNRIYSNTLYIPHSDGAGLAIGSAALENYSAPLVQENVFENNSSAGNGGAVSIQHSCAILSRNQFKNNSCAGDGGAIWGYFIMSAPTIDHNWLSGNSAGDHGGGIYVAVSGEATQITIDSNIIVRNRADGMSADTISAGGIWLFNVAGEMRHNTLAENHGNDDSFCRGGGGIALCEVSPSLNVSENIISFSAGCGLVCVGEPPTFGQNLIWGNAPSEVSGCEAAEAIAVLADPLFCSPETDDYSVSANSPAFVDGGFFGAIETPGCSATVVHQATWGQVKRRFIRRE